MSFFDKIETAWKERGTLLCVGLDPRPDPGEGAQGLYDRAMRLVEACAPYAACFKPNSAFFEAYGEAGMAALIRLVGQIPDETPVLLDAKRCDIGSTAEAYARACFEVIGADAVTLSPYMGRDAADPFLAYVDKVVFMLARTSNPRAGVFQDLVVGQGTLYEAVAAECASWSDRVGLVAAGNDPSGLAAVRRAAPEAWILAPGIGAQGGDIAEAWLAGSRSDDLGILPVAARAIAGAENPASAARNLVEAMRRASKKGNGNVPGTARGAGFGPGIALKRRIMRGLVDTGCFRVGRFTLKSGKVSPFYVDLRRVISDPRLLADIAMAYASAAEGLQFDRIAGIPAAALPLATAAALTLGRPMVWPRMPVKDHGTGNRVEGNCHPGDRLLLLDDLITTGASKREAIEILRAEKLVVEDLVVLIERGKQGRRDMKTQGVMLHAFFHVRELFSLCEELGVIDSVQRRDMEAFTEDE
ncbi:MAG: orotidine-5'-phosphate decarboxylase [Spirochaetales bacterium]|nr:MAG: orotidine-5'-phosphate decarboxylase [Spirochaetales bacterium]